MRDKDVRIERLPSMRVACVVAVSESPEHDSFEKLLSWADKQGVLASGSYRLFGFNNPCPSPGEAQYGYETWITVGPDVVPEGEVDVKEFPGGLFAVTSVQGIAEIGKGWKRLVEWRKASKYQVGSNPCLEEHVAPMPIDLGAPLEEVRLDLYEPLAE